MDIEEEELEQMQRMIGRQVNYQPGHHRGEPINANPHLHQDDLDIDEDAEGEYNVETPHSNFSASGEKLPTNTQQLNNHHHQIQNELR